MKVFVLTREIREKNSYNVEILGVFKDKCIATVAMLEEVSRAENDGWKIVLQGDTAVQMDNDSSVINYTITGKELE
ncbi:MAG: hypothetical protein IJ759_07890 [Bacteroidales bacterium]|nr:hypothetical protein [Bacteroidales bacterium]MBR1775425.1 hypothetical protein [Bacteroidales bacterium]